MKKKKKTSVKQLPLSTEMDPNVLKHENFFLNKKVVNFSMTLVIFNYWLIESIDSDQVTT